MIEEYKALLMHSYLYYHLHSPVISDTGYNYLCRSVAEDWSAVPYGYQQLMGGNTDFARQGSLFFIKKEDYPEEIVKLAEASLHD